MSDAQTDRWRRSEGPYGAIYQRKKAEYAASDRDWTPKRIDNAVRRYAGKKLIRDIWREWRRAGREMAAVTAGRITGSRQQPISSFRAIWPFSG
jgi:capsid protein